MLNEIDKMEKNKHHMILLICVILTQNKQKFKKTHRGTQLISGYQRRKGWRVKWVKGVNCMVMAGH